MYNRQPLGIVFHLILVFGESVVEVHDGIMG